MSLFLVVFDGEDARQTFRLEPGDTLRIGRGQDADLPLQERSVSRRHCVAEVETQRVWLRDTLSRNGTWINGRRLAAEPCPVDLGSVVALGGDRMVLHESPGINQQNWQTCTNPLTLLTFLPGRGGRRKLRLLACAFCRRVPQLFVDPEFHELLEMAERYADGHVSLEDLQGARARALATPTAQTDSGRRVTAAMTPLAEAAPREAASGVLDAVKRLLPNTKMLCGLIRDVLGDFFHRPVVSEAWRSWNEGTVTRMARVIYDERRFKEMPILADALEDAGCDNDDILSHLRGPSPHARGCWVLDSLLPPAASTSATDSLSGVPASTLCKGDDLWLE